MTHGVSDMLSGIDVVDMPSDLEEVEVAAWVRRFVPGGKGTLLARRFVWTAPQDEGAGSSDADEEAAAYAVNEAEVQRLPHSGAPMWTAAPCFSSLRTTVVTRVDVPNVPGAFMLGGVLSRAECVTTTTLPCTTVLHRCHASLV